MKEFESQQFRDELAKKIKEAPKEERRGILSKAREEAELPSGKVESVEIEHLREDMGIYFDRVSQFRGEANRAFKEKEIEKEIKCETEGIQSFEQFHQEITIARPKFIALSKLPEVRSSLKGWVAINKENWSPQEQELFGECRTIFAISAKKAKLITDAVEQGDISAFEEVPREFMGDKIAQLKAYMPESTIESIIKNSLIQGSNRDSLTGAVYNISRNFYNPIEDENTGRRIEKISSQQPYLNTWLRKQGHAELADQIDRLVNFLIGWRIRINREIVLSDEFTTAVEAARKDDPQKQKPETLISLQRLYYQMEINRANEVVPFGRCVEELFQMQDDFNMGLLEETQN